MYFTLQYYIVKIVIIVADCCRYFVRVLWINQCVSGMSDLHRVLRVK